MRLFQDMAASQALVARAMTLSARIGIEVFTCSMRQVLIRSVSMSAQMSD